MLFFVDLCILLVSSGLFYNELHGLNSLSHSSVHLYLDGVQVEMHVLSETYELGEWLLKLAILNMVLTHGKSHTTVGGSIFHGSWEDTIYIFGELFVMIHYDWGILYLSFTVVEFEEEDSCKGLISLTFEVNLISDTNIFSGTKNPHSLVFSIVNLACLEGTFGLL